LVVDARPIPQQRLAAHSTSRALSVPAWLWRDEGTLRGRSSFAFLLVLAAAPSLLFDLWIGLLGSKEG